MMQTDSLISLLSADDTPPRPIRSRLLLQAGLGLLASAAIALSLLGIRPDLIAALGDPVTLMKWLLPLAAGLPALYVALRLTRPQVRFVPLQVVSVLIGCAALGWLLVAAMTAVPGTLWPGMRGNTAMICVTSVALIGVVPLYFGLRILKDGASTSPARSGAMLGLASGGLAAALYALHCNEDAPLFFLTWYGIGMLILTAIGALAGRRVLRW